ncbi:hypothetical protein GWI33_000678 [Rhynchophorus ferrugineus]|uniref:Uncharacterized protein n=1 Tax=Rhynchophorus ferrugineus TaxID=354439 RepID=A0A834ILS1_RHYFE|nr:hypothetical protein GWI33_000678 [Rhynchophorus ferrugineus]
MLTLAMRHSQHSEATRVPPTNNNGDEFVDILQVQQLLLDSNRRESPGYHGSITQSGVPPRLMMDSLVTATTPYYYGNPSYHQTPPGSAGTSMDELVSMWFGSSQTTSGLTPVKRSSRHTLREGLLRDPRTVDVTFIHRSQPPTRSCDANVVVPVASPPAPILHGGRSMSWRGVAGGGDVAASCAISRVLSTDAP